MVKIVANEMQASRRGSKRGHRWGVYRGCIPPPDLKRCWHLISLKINAKIFLYCTLKI